MSASEPVSVHILDREFLIACTAEERSGLLDAARHLDTKMRELRANARAGGMDRIAILAALQISHEMLNARHREEQESARLAEKLQALNATLERAFVS